MSIGRAFSTGRIEALVMTLGTAAAVGLSLQARPDKKHSSRLGRH